ncbi:MAG: hypothetical protein IJF90_05005, partial [Synergistaceae bacterium]|nr:hypothetical protein [Synergistaceae bacterium]
SSNQTSTDQSEQTENKELKTTFESPEVEEFLKEMYAEGLSQENSDYDLSKLFDDSADKTYTPYTDEVDESSSTLAVTQEESSYFELLSKNELSDTELINNLTESNDETEASEADKTAWEDENDRVSSYLNSDTEEGAEATSGNGSEEVTVNAADTASERTQQAASTPAQETSASSTTTTPATKTTTVKETVKDVDTENVSRETTKTETVTTEIVDSETTYETVTKEVETKVPTTVTTEQEQVIETEVFNDEGEMETVTETITVPTTETVYETVTETVTEEVPVNTKYSVKETVVVSTVVTETVTNKYGEVISKKVISSDESSSSRDYVTTSEPSEGTTTNVTTSNDSETVEKVTEREVEKTVTTEVPAETNETVSEETAAPIVPAELTPLEKFASGITDTTAEETNDVYVAPAKETISSSETTVSETETAIKEENNSDDTETEKEEPALKTEISSEEEEKNKTASENTDNIESKDTITETQQTENINEPTVDENIEGEMLPAVSEMLTENYDLDDIALLSNSFSLSSVDDGFSLMSLSADASALNSSTGVNTIAIRVGETNSLTDLFSMKGKSYGSDLPTVTDGRLASIDAGGNIKGLSQGRTTIRLAAGGIYNLEVYGEEEASVLPSAVPMVVSQGPFSLALQNNGSVWGWGGNNDSRLANATSNVVMSPNNIQIKKNGKLVNLTGIKHIAAGDGHALAVTDEGYVYSWGLNANGQLGRGVNSTTASQANPDYVVKEDGERLSNIEYVFAGTYSSYAIAKDGSVWSWGETKYGQLGIGKNFLDDQTDESLYNVKYACPVTTTMNGDPFGNIIKIAASQSHALALDTANNLYIWGDNVDSLLINNDDNYTGTLYLNRPVKREIDGAPGLVIDIAAGGTYIENVGTDTSSEIGLRFHSVVAFDTVRNNVWTWGHNETRQLGYHTGEIDNTGSTIKYTLTPNPTPKAVIPYDTDTLLNFTDGFEGMVVSVTASAYNTAAIVASGNGKVGVPYTWGDNQNQQLGVITKPSAGDEERIPDQLNPGIVLIDRSSDYTNYFTDVDQIVLSSYVTSAVKSDGTVWTWGNNSFGQLGNLAYGNVKQPFPVLTGDMESKTLIANHVMVTELDENGNEEIVNE